MTSTSDQFFQASYKGDLESVRRLLADEPTLARSSPSATWEGGTPLTLAALGGHAEIARLLIDRGASVDPMSNDGSALLMGVWGGHKPMVQLLLDAGADVNLASSSGETPLMAAAYKGLVAIAEVLLDHGARIDAQTGEGTTDFFNTSPPVCGESALHLAAAEGHEKMVEFLLTRGASKSLTDHCGQRALHWAARHHRDELFALLK